MKKAYIVLLSISTIFLAGCWEKTNTIQEPQTSVSQPVTIYAIWDSITAWYQLPIEQSRPSQLQKMLEAAWFTNYKVVNAWKSWDTSKQVKDRLDRSISDAKPWDIAILTIWWNDWFQSVPVSTLEQNIRDIITILQNKWMKVVIGGMQISTNLGSDYTTAFAAIYPKVASDTKSALIPFILKWVALRPELNLPDMIHPNEAWYKIIAETVLMKLEKSNLIKK